MYDKGLVLEIIEQITDAVVAVKERCEFAKNMMISWTQKRVKKSSTAFA